MRHSARPETGRQTAALLRYTLFMIGIGLYAAGMTTGRYGFMMSGILTFFVSNLFFGFAEGKTRYIFLFFHLSIFTFLLGRPMINLFKGDASWAGWYGTEATRTSLHMIFLALLALRLGAWIGDGIIRRLEYRKTFRKERPHRLQPSEKYRSAFAESLAVVSLVLFLVTIAASFAEGIAQLSFMQGRSYNEFFLEYSSPMPYAVITLGAMAKYALCLFLATLPKKRTAVCALLIFLLDAVPSFLIGIRNPVILRLIFSIVYFILRDTAGSTEKWIGRKEKAAMVIGTPAGIAFLGVYASIRLNKAAEGGFLYYFQRFFYNQGVTFDTVRSVVRAMPDLPDTVPKNYTFGPFLDYFLYGSFGQRFFGNPDIGSTNSVIKAVYGNSLAHSSYYVIDPEKYLQGWGKGSAYMLENYADGGFPGVFAFSFVLGILLIVMTYLLKQRSVLLRMILLASLLGLFFSPRAEATGWIAFLTYAQFWLVVAAGYFAAAVCARKYSFRTRSPGAIPPEAVLKG